MIIEVWSSVGMTIKETLNSVDTAQLLSCIVYLHFLQKFLHHRIRAVMLHQVIEVNCEAFKSQINQTMRPYPH